MDQWKQAAGLQGGASRQEGANHTPERPERQVGAGSAAILAETPRNWKDVIRMIRFLKKLFPASPQAAIHSPERLQGAIAALLHEVSRMDQDVRPEDLQAAEQALADLAGIDAAQAKELLSHAGDLRNRVTSYHDAVSVINRAFSMEDRLRLVEHLWRVAHADDDLHLHEDHLVRKLADLMHVSNTQSMLARQRARGRPGS
jgi:uncharacterized tellurite resistance protein B-like protein